MTTVCSEGPRFNTQGDTPPMWTGGPCSERALVTCGLCLGSGQLDLPVNTAPWIRPAKAKEPANKNRGDGVMGTFLWYLACFIPILKTQ